LENNRVRAYNERVQQIRNNPDNTVWIETVRARNRPVVQTPVQRRSPHLLRRNELNALPNCDGKQCAITHCKRKCFWGFNCGSHFGCKFCWMQMCAFADRQGLDTVLCPLCGDTDSGMDVQYFRRYCLRPYTSTDDEESSDDIEIVQVNKRASTLISEINDSDTEEDDPNDEDYVEQNRPRKRSHVNNI
jgi:hypothetical protein